MRVWSGVRLFFGGRGGNGGDGWVREMVCLGAFRIVEGFLIRKSETVTFSVEGAG